MRWGQAESVPNTLVRDSLSPAASRGGKRSGVRLKSGTDRHNHVVTHRQPDPAPGADPERGFVVAVLARGADPAEELAEIRELARIRVRPDPRTYVGKGKLEELKQSFGESGAESMLVDDELDPAQQRRLEDLLKARVVDRTQLILNIFAQHARSAEGKLQAEL